MSGNGSSRARGVKKFQAGKIRSAVLGEGNLQNGGGHRQQKQQRKSRMFTRAGQVRYSRAEQKNGQTKQSAISVADRRRVRKMRKCTVLYSSRAPRDSLSGHRDVESKPRTQKKKRKKNPIGNVLAAERETPSPAWKKGRGGPNLQGRNDGTADHKLQPELQSSQTPAVDLCHCIQSGSSQARTRKDEARSKR